MKKKLVLMTSALMTIGLLAGCGNQHTHEWGDVSYTWAEDNSTCTATRVCKGDESHVETETVDTTSVVVTEAKCEEDGLKRYTADFKTNEAFLDQTKDVTLEAIGHDYQFAEFVWTEFTAQAKYVCSHDASHVQLHDATVTNEVTTQPGCETEGVRTYTASYDGHTGTKTEVIPASEHSWGEPTYVWSDDNLKCTATRVCTKDANHVDIETVNAVITPYEEPDCTNDGYGKYTATFTKEAFAVQEKEAVIARLGHDYQFSAIIWDDEGYTAVAELVCSHDASHTKYENATITSEVTTQPGCETEGVRTYTANYDGHTSTKTGPVSATGHNWNNPTYTWSADNSTCTATRVCANDESHVETETVNTSISSSANPTCTEDGSNTYLATFTNVAFSAQSKTVTVPALDHSWGTAEYEWSSDYSSCVAIRHCTHDNEHVRRDNAIVTVEIVTAATASAYGTGKFVATFEDETLESAETEAIAAVPNVELSEDSQSYSVVRLKDVAVSGPIAIPGSINGLPVTKIGPDAFYMCEDITSVYIPASVKYIDTYAFSGCKSLTSVVLEKNSQLEKIGAAAFSFCNNLAELAIPDSVTSIGDAAFDKTNLVTNCIKYDNALYLGNESNPYFILFAGKENTIESVSIHKNCEFINSFAFNQYTALSSVTFEGNNVKSILSSAFYSCDALVKIDLPDSIKNISSNAFAYCDALTNFTFGRNPQLETVGGNAFYQSGALVFNEYDNAKYIGDTNNPYLILHSGKNESITSVVIHKGCRVIYGNAFKNYSSLASATVEEGNALQSLGTSAFQGCTPLKAFDIPSTVTFIGTSAFRDCKSLTSIVIPQNVEQLGGNSFRNCDKLSNFTYLGTKAQWNSITKGGYWNTNLAATVVHCSDGDVTL